MVTVLVAPAVAAMTVLAATGEPELAWALIFSPVFAEARFAVPAVAWAQIFLPAVAWNQLDEPVAVEDAL